MPTQEARVRLADYTPEEQILIREFTAITNAEYTPGCRVNARAGLVAKAVAWWPWLYRGSEPAEAGDLRECTRRFEAKIHEVLPVLETCEGDVDARGVCVGLVSLLTAFSSGWAIRALASWAHYGCPIVRQASHRFAAVLEATPVTTSVPVEPPWPHFLMELPTGGRPQDRLTYTNEAGERREALYALVSRYKNVPGRAGPTWSFMVFDERGSSIFDGSWTLEEMATDNYGDEPMEYPNAEVAEALRLRAHLEAQGIDSGFVRATSATAPTESAGRLIRIIRRLAINSCLALSSPNCNGKDSESEGQWPAIKCRARREGDPDFRLFEVGQPVTIDCRDAVASFLRGERGTERTVQWPVRGHWRIYTHERYAASGLQGQAQFIAPHWAGDPQAPMKIAVRIIRH